MSSSSHSLKRKDKSHLLPSFSENINILLKKCRIYSPPITNANQQQPTKPIELKQATNVLPLNEKIKDIPFEQLVELIKTQPCLSSNQVIQLLYDLKDQYDCLLEEFIHQQNQQWTDWMNSSSFKQHQESYIN